MKPLIAHYETNPGFSDKLPLEVSEPLVECYIRHFSDANTNFPKMTISDVSAQVTIHTRWLSELGIGVLLRHLKENAALSEVYSNFSVLHEDSNRMLVFMLWMFMPNTQIIFLPHSEEIECFKVSANNSCYPH